MLESIGNLPNPDKDTVSSWLSSLPEDYLAHQGWETANQRFHGIAMAARRHANEHLDPGERAAFFDGLTLGLAVLAREQDIAELNAMFEASTADS
jgi:hypothetical protein